MSPKIKNVKPFAEYTLLVAFENGERKKYGIETACKKWDVFQNLLTIPSLFEQVKLDQGGYGISWNDEIDLSANELYQNGKEYSDENKQDIFADFEETCKATEMDWGEAVGKEVC